MAKTPSKELANTASDETLALLRNEFPTEPGFERQMMPRISFKSQDVTEETKVNGKKQIKVVIEAGTFLLEKPTDDEDPETGKKLWSSDELGTELEGTIVFQRKQLRYYDEPTETFISSPIYDNDDEVLPLFAAGAEIDRGTPAELQSKYPGVTQAGKPKSNLEVNRILYVLYEGELYQLNLRGSSMYSYLGYLRKARPAVPALLTHFSSEPKEKGSIAWNQMTFETVRPLSETEARGVLERQREIKDAIEQEKSFFAAKDAQNAAFNKENPLAVEYFPEGGAPRRIGK